MNAIFKTTASLLRSVERDLARPHPFAAERVGFLTASAGRTPDGVILLATGYISVPDDGYEDSYDAAAVINETTIRNALQTVYTERVGIVHIHLHEHRGRPAFSLTDETETGRFMPPFANVRPEQPHAAVIRSRDHFVGRCWMNATVLPITRFVIVGDHLRSTS